MSRGFPSMTALLGLLAIAGYQNRDKLAEMLGGAGQKGPGGAAPGQHGGQQGGLGGLLEQFKGAGVGGGAARAARTYPRRRSGPVPKSLTTQAKGRWARSCQG